MSWWIKKWSRELGRGQIEGTMADSLDFDASAALVDDFRTGEEVHVQLERDGDTWRVTKIWPDDPRFVARVPVAGVAPALDPALEKAAQATVNRISLQERYRLSAIEGGRLVLCGEQGYSYPPPSDEIIFDGVRYIELVSPIYIKSFRLSRPEERDYLATRVGDFASSDITITLYKEHTKIWIREENHKDTKARRLERL